MANITRFSRRCDLSARRSITLDLPEFLLRAFEQRIAEANDGAPADERVSIEHIVELQLAEGLSIAEVAILEREMPGIGEAVSRWLEEID